MKGVKRFGVLHTTIASNLVNQGLSYRQLEKISKLFRETIEETT